MKRWLACWVILAMLLALPAGALGEEEPLCATEDAAAVEAIGGEEDVVSAPMEDAVGEAEYDLSEDGVAALPEDGEEDVSFAVEAPEADLPADVAPGELTEVAVEGREGFPEEPVDNDARFGDYMRRIFYPDDDPPMASNAEGRKLTGNFRTVYEYIKNEIMNMAAGWRSSTSVDVSLDMLFGATVVTARSLGIQVQYSAPGVVTAESANRVKEAFNASINFAPIMDALWNDCKYELFFATNWSYSGFSYNTGYDAALGDYAIYLGEYTTVAFRFPVDKRYSGGGDYVLNTAWVATAMEGRQRAEGIVAKYAGDSDYAKLYGYAWEICELTDYNYAALEPTWDESNQNPWQLYWVFDSDPTTLVVCAGYAAAFQYLCDLTHFDTGIRVYTASGFVDGDPDKGHAWNIVTMEDGKNYLVDTTWMDGDWKDAYGSMARWIYYRYGGLFLSGASAGSVSGGYYVDYRHRLYSGRDEGNTFRTYGENTMARLSPTVLTLSRTAYVISGFQRIQGKTYYFQNDGRYVTGTLELNGMYYQFGPDGALESGWAAGWQTVNGRQVFFDESGLHTAHTVVIDPGVPVSCAHDGLTEGSHCAVCGMVLEAQAVLPALPHRAIADPAVPASFYATGLTEGSHCKNCGTVLVPQYVTPVSNDLYISGSTTVTVNVGRPIQIHVDGHAIKSCKSGNKKVAKVTRSGYVTTKKAGTAKITVNIRGRKMTLKVKVVDPYAPNSVSILQGGSYELRAGETLQLNAVMYPDTARSSLKWKSSKKGVAKVSGDGVVTAKKKGTAKITVTTGNGKKATIKIKVK